MNRTTQAMKTLRQELSADGRMDILERVMSYRGGYSQEVCHRSRNECFQGSRLQLTANS